MARRRAASVERGLLFLLGTFLPESGRRHLPAEAKLMAVQLTKGAKTIRPRLPKVQQGFSEVLQECWPVTR